MILSLIIAVLIVTVSSAQIGPLRSPIVPGGRIVGGASTNIEAHPHQVSLARYGSHSCGGSIVSPRHVLTAGHCVSSPASSITVRSGSSYLNSGNVSRVQRIIRHENYTVIENGIPINDVALLVLAEPLSFGKTRRAVGLFNQREEAAPGVKAVITGWGRTGSGSLPNQLQAVSIPIVSKNLCNDAYRRYGGIPPNQICAAYYGEGGKDSCQGDSGGPLVINGRQAGIVSWGNGCAQPYYPGVYTEVAAYRSWIDRNIRQFENIDELEYY